MNINKEVKAKKLEEIRSLAKEISDFGTVLGAMSKIAPTDAKKKDNAEKAKKAKDMAKFFSDLCSVIEGNKPSKSLLASGLIEEGPVAEVKKAEKVKSTNKSENSTAKRAKSTSTKKSTKQRKSKAK